MSTKPMSQIPAGQFKARCLAILDEVQRQRRGIVVSKRGKPVARVVPVEDADAGDSLRGSVLYEGDLVSPLSERWNES
jgi:prevent-host-death family protein